MFIIAAHYQASHYLHHCNSARACSGQSHWGHALALEFVSAILTLSHFSLFTRTCSQLVQKRVSTSRIAAVSSRRKSCCFICSSNIHFACKASCLAGRRKFYCVPSPIVPMGWSVIYLKPLKLEVSGFHKFSEALGAIESVLHCLVEIL